MNICSCSTDSRISCATMQTSIGLLWIAYKQVIDLLFFVFVIIQDRNKISPLARNSWPYKTSF